MPVDINVSVRCTSKNLMTGGIPAGGGAPTDSINVQCQLIQAAGGPTGSINMSFPLTEDHFIVGGYYDLTMIDGTAPVTAKSDKPGDKPDQPQRPPLARS